MTTRPFLGLPLFGRGHITGRSATFWADRPLFGRSATGRSLWSIKALKFWLQVSLAQSFLGKAFMSKILVNSLLWFRRLFSERTEMAELLRFASGHY